jgi:cell shape-determining protein MreC
MNNEKENLQKEEEINKEFEKIQEELKQLQEDNKDLKSPMDIPDSRQKKSIDEDLKKR